MVRDMIIVDVHEPKDLQVIADRVEDIACDILIYSDEEIYAIERKTVWDLAGSVKQGRLWNQLQRLKEIEGAVPVLVVEGNIYAVLRAKKGGMSLPMWVGIRAGILRMGVMVIQTLNKQDTIMFIKNLHDRITGRKESHRAVTIRKSARTIEEEAEDMLVAVTGIGRKKAKELLNRFGSVRRVVEQDKVNLVSVLGEKVGGHFYEVVNTNFTKSKVMFDGRGKEKK